MTDGPKTLYICYFGVREPLVQTQVLPYLCELIKGGIDVSLLTFEPELSSWSAAEIDSQSKRFAADGITWHRLAYHKRPSAPATLYDTLNGARLIRGLIERERFDVLHCRVHVPALMGVIARRLSRHKPKLIFDIRGFFPEEYTDAGIWPENGWLYRSVKRVERTLLAEADGFIVLTEKAADILFPDANGAAPTGRCDPAGRPIEVIPCCVDLERFDGDRAARRLKQREALGVGDRFVLVYVGSFGGWYLSDEMFEMFSAIREIEPSLYVMIITQRDKESAVSRLEAAGFTRSDFCVETVQPERVPEFLAAADAAVSFVKACYSKQASSPTKNAEYLAAGLPILANTGVGDVDALIDETRTGVLIDQFDEAGYRGAFRKLKALEDAGDRCIRTAEERFDLEKVGGARYRRIYERLGLAVGDLPGEATRVTRQSAA